MSARKTVRLEVIDDLWCFLEGADDDERKPIAHNSFGSWFTASQARLSESFKFFGPKKQEYYVAESKDVADTEHLFTDNDEISAILNSGIVVDGGLKDVQSFSMLGYNAPITDFLLKIRKVVDVNGEFCKVENNYSFEEGSGLLIIKLGLAEKRFEKLADYIANKTLDTLHVYLENVSGLYSYGPVRYPSNVKILSKSNLIKVAKPEGCDIDPPVLGDVENFFLNIKRRPNINTVPNILCDDEVEQFEDLGRGKEKEDENSIKLLIAKHQRSQSELKYLVGFIAILLLLILWK